LRGLETNFASTQQAKIRGNFQSERDQAIIYSHCCSSFFCFL